MAASSGESGYKVLSGLCPDSHCRAKLFFPSQDSSVECTSCGQRHSTKTLMNVEPVTNPDVALHNMLLNILVGNVKLKKGADSVKVLGLSNYLCKILSPLLTIYGMDKKTKLAVSLKEMGQTEMFDCAVLGDRAFLLDPEHIDTIGYGKDRTGSMNYLADTLDAINRINNQECLVPIHADGDGHCLVHAVSRALVGRELFWHALRENLKKHFRDNLSTYKLQFHDFIDASEWEVIINECDPYYLPPNGEPLGLRNIHIFGLANVLHRPIVLLDSMSGLQSSGDYSGVFLPALVPPEKCRSKDDTLNKPICLAWSNSGRNHYVALVAVKGQPLPTLPNWMISRAWGMPVEAIGSYMDYNDDGSCTVGGSKCLSDLYIRNLARSMEIKFSEVYEVSPSLIADVHHYVYKSTGVIGTCPEDVINETRDAVKKKMLYRCLTCEAVTLWRFEDLWFQRGGMLYQLALTTHGELMPGKKYSFPLHGIVCGYDATSDQLVPDMEMSKLSHCGWCQGAKMRLLNADGSVNYINGDKTTTRTSSTRCQCGFKHFWDGIEYDNVPEIIPLSLDWDGQVIQESVAWFYGESDPSLNSNVYQVANKVVQKHFPGEFGSELLVQKVVDTIIRQTAKREQHQECSDVVKQGHVERSGGDASIDSSWRKDRASKVILTGPKRTTIHKEELTASNVEKDVHSKIVNHAASQQRKQSDKLRRLNETTTSPPSVRPKASPSNLDASAATAAVSPKEPTVATFVRKVKVTTSGGKQVMLSLEPDVTFSALQERITAELGVPVNQQKIKYGFPLKELMPPVEGNDSCLLPLQHGDRVVVEDLSCNKHTSSYSTTPKMPEKVWPAEKPRQGWTNFQTDIHDQSSEALLQDLNQMHNDFRSGNSLDMSIASLSLLATLNGRDLWSYCQTAPHLFSVGGLFYQQVQRDLGLSDGKHCTLPSLPGKVFRYNGAEDRLELCLEPAGHFPVEPGVEQKYQDSFASATTVSVGHTLSTGTAAVAVNTPMNMGHIAFTGQGHTLSGNKENIKMPQDLEPNHQHHNRVKSFNDYSRFGHRPDSIQEEDEESPCGDGSDTYERVGPGYSVVKPVATSKTNRQMHVFDQLAKTFEKTISEEDSQDECFEDDLSSFSNQAGNVDCGFEQKLEMNETKTNVAMDTQDLTESDNMDT